MYSEQETTEVSGIRTVESLLAAMRRGNSQRLELKMGDDDVPVRLLSAHEEALTAVKAAQSAIKRNPTGLKPETFEAQCMMKAILFAATTIGGTPTIGERFYESLTATELGYLYDQYVTLNHTINPNIQEMKSEEIAAIVDDIKKKKRAAKDFYTYQLAAVGKYFLQEIIPNLPTDSAPGS